jgi:hypothetical protein
MPGGTLPSARTPIRFQGGRLHAQPARPQLRLGRYLSETRLPAPPPESDWLSRVASWPMYGNDQLGDCTAAAVGHLIQALTTYGQGATVTVTDQDVLKLYEATGHYVPGDPSTDRGAYILDVLDHWQKVGVAGHRILAHATVDIGDQAEIERAIDLFGGIDIGVNLPQSAEDQFNNGEPWTYVRGSRTLGGHSITLGAYTAKGPGGVTWAEVQEMDWNWFERYADEGHVVITTDWLSAQGTDPQGLDIRQLGADFAALTGRPDPIAPHLAA